MTEWTEDGRPAAWETETESAFDAEERESWEALAEWRLSLCPDCRRPRAICSNPDGAFGHGYYPQRRICWITAAEQVAQREFAKMHEKAQPDEGGYLPTDGVAIFADLEDTNPDDDFLTPPALRSVLVAAKAAAGDDQSEQDKRASDEER